MPLQKTSVPISFAQGVDLKTDPLQVVQGKLLKLENGIFINPQRITKRNGHKLLGNALNGYGCASYQDELLAFDGTSVLSYAANNASLKNKGYAVSVEVNTDTVVSNDYSQTCADGAVHSIGLKCFAWEDQRGGIRYSVKDSETGQVLVADQLVDVLGVKPKVFALGNAFVIIYFDGTNLKQRHCSVTSPQTLVAAADVATNIKTTVPTYDATKIGDRIFIAYNNSESGGGVSLMYIQRNLSLSSDYRASTEVANPCISVFGDANENAWVVYYNGTGLKAFITDYELNAVVTAAAVETIANVRNVTGIITSTTSTLVSTAKIFYEVSAVSAINHLVRTVTLSRSSSSVTAGTPAVFLPSVGLTTKPFTYQGGFYLGVGFGSSVQPTYFIVNSTGTIIAKVFSQTAGGLTAKSVLPEVSQLTASEFMIPWLQRSLLEVEYGIIFSPTGVSATSFSFESVNTFLRSYMGQNLHVTGGFLSMYDGVSVVEHGFHLFPEPSAITSALTAGGIGPGTYQYSTVYEWQDNKGNIHRSAPSTPQTLVLPSGTALTFTGNTTAGSVSVASVSSTTGLFVGQRITGTDIPADTFIATIGTGAITMTNASLGAHTGLTFTTTDTNKVTLVVPTLRMTAKKSPRTNVMLCVYRTQDSGTIFYKVTSITSPTFNDPTSDTVTIYDTIPDFYLNGNELLYTTGGVIENIGAPACALIASFNNRLVIVPSENRLTYWFSKEVREGTPVEFSDYFVKVIDARDGDITAIVQMDEKLILFKRNTCWLTAGNGPTDVGTQDDFVNPELITTDAGCKNPRSVVVTPQGIMRQSEKGIYLLDRSLQDVYIGAEVEAYNGEDITSAVLVPNTNQVRFTTSTGTCLVYDYLFKQWSVFTHHEASDATVFENLFTFITPEGLIYQETPGLYLDGSDSIVLKVKTSWLSFAGLQGFQRVYQTLILGEYKSPHDLKVSAAYDFNPYATQETYINAGALLENPAYGIDSPYGAGTPYGGEYPLYQFRVFMTRQKCQSVQLTIEEVQNGAFGEGASWSAMNFLVGVKGGTYKLPTTRSFG